LKNYYIKVFENRKGGFRMTEKEKKKRGMKTIDAVYIGLFAAVMAVCSWISIPLTVPVTLQTFGVCCAVGLLGLKRGTAAVMIYILL